MELAFDSCTNGCTRLSDSVQDSLEKLAADLRRRLSADDCRRLAELVIQCGADGGMRKKMNQPVGPIPVAQNLNQSPPVGRESGPPEAIRASILAMVKAADGGEIE